MKANIPPEFIPIKIHIVRRPKLRKRTSLNEADISSLTILAAAVAGIIQIMSSPGRFGPASVIIGSILLLILSTYHITAGKNKRELIGLSMVWALASVITFGYGIELLNDWLVPKVFFIPENKILTREMEERVITFREGIQVGIWIILLILIYPIAYWKRRKAQILEKQALLLDESGRMSRRIDCNQARRLTTHPTGRRDSIFPKVVGFIAACVLLARRR